MHPILEGITLNQACETRGEETSPAKKERTGRGELPGEKEHDG